MDKRNMAQFSIECMAIEETLIRKRHRKNAPIDITWVLRHSQSLSTLTTLNQWECKARNTPTSRFNYDQDKLQSVAVGGCFRREQTLNHSDLAELCVELNE